MEKSENERTIVKKSLVYLSIILVMCVGLVACSKNQKAQEPATQEQKAAQAPAGTDIQSGEDEQIELPAVTGATPSAEAAEKDKADQESTKQDDKEPEAVTPAVTQTVTVAPTEEKEDPETKTLGDTDEKTEKEAGDSGENKDTEDKKDTSKEESTSKEDNTSAAETLPVVLKDDGRLEAWSTSFLVRVPVVIFGNMAGTEAADTFDYAIFNDVTRADVNSYIASLKILGYTTAHEAEADGLYSYEADKESDGWVVTLKYIEAESWFCVGSGFYDAEEDSEAERLDRLFSTTMLMYVPKPGMGKLENVKDADAEDRYVSAVFSGIEETGAEEYIGKLRELGFIYDVDEGNEDGFIWYSAMSEDRLVCDFEYYDGICSIGCGLFIE